MTVKFKVFSRKIRHLKRVKAKKEYFSVRTSVGSKISKNCTARQILRLNVIKSRRDHYPMNEIVAAYSISSRTVHKFVNLFDKISGGIVTKRIYRFMGKLIQRAYFTTLWIRFIVRHKVTDLQLILDHIDQETRPP